MLTAQPALAAERWPYGVAMEAAFGKGDYAATLAALRTELGKCEASKPGADECFDLLLALSNVAASAGDAKAGETYARRALALAERTLKPVHSDIAASWNNLASNLDDQGRDAEAEPLYRKALLVRRGLSSSHPARIVGHWSMAGVLQYQRKSPAEVRSLYREAERGALERMRSFVSFTPAAQAEIRKYRPIFTGQVRAAWDLASGAR